MSLMSFFSRRTTAPVARDRLQILLAHERGIVGGKSDLVALLREEILAAIRRHVSVDPDKVQITLERGESISTLEIEVEIPSPAVQRLAVNA
jgi:cell division topological specificity factor